MELLAPITKEARDVGRLPANGVLPLVLSRLTLTAARGEVAMMTGLLDGVEFKPRGGCREHLGQYSGSMA